MCAGGGGGKLSSHGSVLPGDLLARRDRWAPVAKRNTVVRRCHQGSWPPGPTPL